MNTPLAEALDRLVPSCEREFGNWQQVLAAGSVSRPDTTRESATAPQSRHQRRVTRPRLIIVAVALAAITVLFTTPAFGLRDLIFNFIGGRTSVSFVKSRPAPPEIKKRFLDFFTGGPPGMNPQVLPAEARQITFRGAAGQKRILWVAPTRGGGFCSILVGGGGGCISKQTEHRHDSVTIDGSFAQKHGQQPRFLEVEGHVFSSKVATLTLEFRDHQSIPIPFVYIMSPINAGFYLTGVPSDHQQQGHWPSTLVARNAQGTIIATATIHAPSLPLGPNRPGRISTPRQRLLPTAPPVAPSAPLQTGTADGFTVVVGHNNAVQFREVASTPTLRQLVGSSVSYSCFRLTREFGIFTVRGLGQEARFAEKIGFQLYGVGMPVDGCDIEGSGGHRWPDRNGSHSAVEIPLTAKGRAYFADRAAARDLALFVRSARMQQIRKEPGLELLRDMKAAYGVDLRHSPIHYTLTPGGITFTEKSTTGKLFRVVLEHGRIKKSNVAPYAFVH